MAADRSAEPFPSGVRLRPALSNVTTTPEPADGSAAGAAEVINGSHE